MAKITKSFVIYKNCETLPVYNFMKIINTDNLDWLIKGYEDGLEYEHKENLEFAWEEIIKEYLDLKKDKKVLQSYSARIVIKRLEDKLSVCSQLVNLCSIDIGLENIEKISNSLQNHDKSYKIDISKPINEEKNRLIKVLKKLKFSIDIKKSNFESEFKTDDVEVRKLDIYSEMVNLEQSLPKSYEIDPKTTVVAKWIALCNLAKKQNG